MTFAIRGCPNNPPPTVLVHFFFMTNSLLPIYLLTQLRLKMAQAIRSRKRWSTAIEVKNLTKSLFKNRIPAMKGRREKDWNNEGGKRSGEVRMKKWRKRREKRRTLKHRE